MKLVEPTGVEVWASGRRPQPRDEAVEFLELFPEGVEPAGQGRGTLRRVGVGGPSSLKQDSSQ